MSDWRESLKCGGCGGYPPRRTFETSCCGRVLCAACAKPSPAAKLDGRIARPTCPACGSAVFWCHESRVLRDIIGQLPRRCETCQQQYSRRDWRDHWDVCPERTVLCRLCPPADRSPCKLAEIVDHLRSRHSLQTVRELGDCFGYCA